MSVLVDEARALADKALPGPWGVWESEEYEPYDDLSIRMMPSTNVIYTEIAETAQPPETAEFIARSRTLVPRLCDEIDHISARVDSLKQALEIIVEKAEKGEPRMEWAHVIASRALEADAS